jgi:putative sigma-54 modulation protein
MTRKAEKLLTYFDRLTSIAITIDFAKGKCSVEILVDAEHRHDLVATETHDDATAAFDLTLHKMEHQLRKYKEKIQDHKRGSGLSDLPLKSSDTEDTEE